MDLFARSSMPRPEEDASPSSYTSTLAESYRAAGTGVLEEEKCVAEIKVNCLPFPPSSRFASPEDLQHPLNGVVESRLSLQTSAPTRSPQMHKAPLSSG